MLFEWSWLASDARSRFAPAVGVAVRPSAGLQGDPSDVHERGDGVPCYLSGLDLLPMHAPGSLQE